MRIHLTIFLLIISFTVYSQRIFEGVVVDSKTQIPLQFCDVSNGERLSFTNSKGMFKIMTTDSLLSFSLLGYENKKINLEENFPDTISLDSYFSQLDEVIVLGENDIFKDIRNNIKSNYPFEPTTNTYHIRATGKKENRLIKFVDLITDLTSQSVFSTSENPRPKKKLNCRNLCC